jgi:hypothetical protein
MYAKQKLYETILCLMGDGPIEERLTFAAFPLVVLSNSPDPDTPPDIQKRLERMVKVLTIPLLSDATGSVARPFPHNQCRKMSEEILSIYTDVVSHDSN